MKLSIRFYGDPILRTKAKAVGEITPEITQLAHDMVAAMVEYNGVGLAAPQVGHLLRIYVFRDEWLNENGQYELGHPQVVINPVLTSPSKETETLLEGCLSLPNLHVKVTRPKRSISVIRILKGKSSSRSSKDISLSVNMHENDHLNGVLHIDRATPKDRKAIEASLQKLKQ